MRGITTAVFFTVCFVIACTLAAPSNSKWGKNNNDQVTGDVDEEPIYPSGRTRPSSPRRGGGSEGRSSQQGQGPYLLFREPKSIGGSESGPWGRVSPKSWPRYRIQQARDDDESEEEDDEDAEDDIQDDEGSDEDQYAFDTPSWDDIYPKEETGPYAQRNAPVHGGQSSSWGNSVQQQQPQSASGYSLSPGTPGSQGYQGRSGYRPAPRNWGPGRSQVRQRGPVAWVKVPKQSYYGGDDQDVEGPTPWYGQSRWSDSSAGNWNDDSGPVYYQPPRQRPQYVRRSWNWRPRPQQVESEEDSVEIQPQPTWVSSQGPRRVVKNWSKTRPSTWQRRGPIQKWGYY